LSRERSPLTILTLHFATPNRLAMTFISAALARPSTGGFVTRTITAPSRSPAISVRAARG
jgi:hypothetical protein